MALTFRLENRDASDTFDLLNGFRLVDGSYAPEVGSREPITDVFEVVEKDTAAQLRSKNNDLEKEFLEKARAWLADRWRTDSIWLRWMSDGENAKRALLYDYSKRNLATPAANVFLGSNTLRLGMALTRHWCFEDVTVLTGSDTSISCFGGMVNFATVTPSLSGGVVDGRIARLYLNPDPSDDLTRYWIGIKPVSGSSSFNPIFECEDASDSEDYIGDTGTAGDAAASGSSAKRTTFSTEEAMAYRFGLKFGTSISREDLVGRYVVLLRCGLSASGGAVGIRLSVSWEDPTAGGVALQRLSTQYIEHTNYRLVEMGEIEIPPGGFRKGMADVVGSLQNLRLNIEAERISGSAALYSDCFILIPAEHYCHLDKAAAGAILWVLTHEDDTQEAYTYDSALVSYPEKHFSNWFYPKDGGLLVLAAERATEHVLADNITAPEINVYRRWLTYAG